MTCQIPVLHLPQELRNVTSQTGPFVPVASLTNKTAGVTLNLFIGIVMDNLQNLRNISKNKPYIKIKLIPLSVKFTSVPDVVGIDPTVSRVLRILVRFQPGELQ